MSSVSSVSWRGSGGVQKDDLWRNLRNQTVCVLRARGATDAQRDRIVVEAEALNGARYDYADVMKAATLFMKMKLGIGNGNLDANQKAYLSDSLQYKRLICSKMIFAAYSKAMWPDSPLDVTHGRPTPIFTPADIYIADGFDDVVR